MTDDSPLVFDEHRAFNGPPEQAAAYQAGFEAGRKEMALLAERAMLELVRELRPTPRQAQHLHHAGPDSDVASRDAER